MKYFSLLLFLFWGQSLRAQPPHYLDSVTAFRNQYIATHGVIKEKDRAGLQFYPIDTSYLKATRVERIYEAPGLPWKPPVNQKNFPGLCLSSFYN